MICLFCHQELTDQIKSWAPALPSDQSRIVFEEFECKPCKAIYNTLESSGKIIDYSLDCETYRLCFGLEDHSFELVQYKFQRIGWPRLIVRLDSLPQNINPSNIENKLQTLLTFL